MDTAITDDFIENFRKSFKKYDPYLSWNLDLNLKKIILSNGNYIFIIKIPDLKFIQILRSTTTRDQHIPLRPGYIPVIMS